MGLDSVEIVIGWEETFGITIADAEAERLITPGDAIELIAGKLAALDQTWFCPTLRAFHRVRTGIRSAIDNRTKRIAPDNRIRDLHDDISSGQFWERFRAAAELPNFRRPRFLFHRPTVCDLVDAVLNQSLKDLLRPGEPWTRPLIRFGVRHAIADITGSRDFHDTDRFVQDIGIG